MCGYLIPIKFLLGGKCEFVECKRTTLLQMKCAYYDFANSVRLCIRSIECEASRLHGELISRESGRVVVCADIWCASCHYARM